MSVFLDAIKSTLRRTGQLPRFYHLVNRFRPQFESLSPSNLQAIIKGMQIAPSGDYYEFGVYKGFALWFATQIAAALDRTEMRFFGFDSFDGLPEPKGLDNEPGVAGTTFARGCFCAGIDLVRGCLERYGADMTRVALIKGFFEDVLNPGIIAEHDMGKASIVLLDCDMYESTKTVLRFLPALLQQGTVLLFDDWRLTDENNGQQLACREWLEANPNIQLQPFCEFKCGQGFTVTAC